MANKLKMAIVQSILSLQAQGWSGRRIAATLEINRETVSRHLRQQRTDDSKPANAPIFPAGSAADSKPAIAPTGCEVATEPAPAEQLGPIPIPSDRSLVGSKPANATIPPAGSAANSAANSTSTNAPSSGSGRISNCTAWQEFILSRRAQDLSTKRIHQDLVAEPGASAISYDSVRRFLKRHAAARPIPFRRMECEPGQEAQVDFGSGAPVIGADGKRRKTNVFRIVLSHSRKAYSEATFTQTAEDFIRCLENAFAHFGGAPQTLVVDNLKAAVAHPDWFDPVLNPKLQSFAQHYGTVILPTKPYTPRHKGKVESGVKYVKNNALKARTFSTLEEQNRFLAEWERTIADTRIHGTTKRQVEKVFREVERAALIRLPLERFPFFHEARRKVSRDGHIEVAKAYYSAPPEYLGREVWARWDARLVRIFNQRFEQIALHTRREPGRFSTLGEHIVPEKISGVERGTIWLLGKIRGIGEQAQAWAETMLKNRGIEGIRVLQGLLSLNKKHSCAALNEACQTALSHGAYRLQTLRALLKRRGVPQPELPFLDEHPLIRPLSDYGGWVQAALARHGGRGHPAPSPLPPDHR